MNSIHVDLVLVTYNSRRFLPGFFATLKETTLGTDSGFTFHLLVIDNASTDQTCSYLHRLKPNDPLRQRMKLIFNPHNIGLSKAWNLGINLCTGNFIILVNPDLKFSPGWLAGMVSCALHHPDAGVVGAKIVGFNKLIDHAGYLDGVVQGRGEPEDAVRYNREIAVDGIHGCCFLIKRQILATVGNFDERFFLYAEEDDFCRRVRQAGFTVYYSPAKIYHYGAGSAIPYLQRNKLHDISLQKFYQKWGYE